MPKTFTVAPGSSSITCLRCGMTSYNVRDVQWRYCGNCREFHELSRCDFCMTPDVPLPGEYRSKTSITVEMPGMGEIRDDGIWMACERCKAVIDAKRWADLIEIGVAGTMMTWPHPPEKDRCEITLQVKALLREVFGELTE